MAPSERLVGWSPLPPDEIIVEVRESPRYWMFVEPQEIFAANLLAVYVNPAPVLSGDGCRHRTVLIQNQGFAVKPRYRARVLRGCDRPTHPDL